MAPKTAPLACVFADSQFKCASEGDADKSLPDAYSMIKHGTVRTGNVGEWIALGRLAVQWLEVVRYRLAVLDA